MSPPNKTAVKQAPKPLVFEPRIEKLEILIKDAKSMNLDLAGLFGKGPQVAPSPMVCVKGDERPSLIGSYQGPGSCGFAQAKEAQSLALSSYENECVAPVEAMHRRIAENIAKGRGLGTEELEFLKAENRFTSVNMLRVRKYHPLADHKFQVPGTPLFKFQTTDCESAQYSIPVTLKNLGLENAESIHPLFRILQYLNVDQLHDFRSAASFLRIAQNMEFGLVEAKQRSLTLSYPASGSHLATLVIPFTLIDDGIIDQAALTFTEIDSNSSKRIDAYLKALTALPLDPANPASEKLITDLKKETVAKNPGSEEIFRFRYRDKAVTLTVALNRSANHFIDDSYLQDSNLVIIHDLNDSAESKRIVETAAKFRKAKSEDTPLWIASDTAIEGLETLGKKMGFEGRFGCGSVEDSGVFFANKTFSFLSEGNQSLFVQSARDFFNPFGKTSAFENINIHLKQKTIPVRLVQIGGKTGPWNPQSI